MFLNMYYFCNIAPQLFNFVVRYYKVMTKEYLQQLFKDNEGCLHSEKLKGSSIRYHLNQMIASGEVIKVRHGLYVHTQFHVFDERLLVAEMIPGGVFCLFSAWQLHELTTAISHQYHLAVSRRTKISSLTNLPLVFYYQSEHIHSIGISQILIENKPVRCYNKEKSVCDSVKYRNKTGEDIMEEVLKNYMSGTDKNLDKLLKYANMLRVEKIIMPYIKSLI
jgi:predicted transcriptional regulator of viral defense system